MGSDIHFFVEKKDASGQWQSADVWETEDGEDRPSVPYQQRFYHGRNYDLFAILANVRNGYGFAGIDTGDGFVPVTGEETRGLPEDVSPQVKAESDAWGCDGHSHQWLTLAEMLAYDWTQVTKHRGIVGLAEYLRWQSSYEMRYSAGGCSPRSWCGMSIGASVVNLPEDEVKLWEDKAREAGKRSHEEIAAFINEAYPGKSLGVAAEWQTPYYKSASGFFADTLPRLLKLAGGDHDSVRCVFWFDN